LKESNSNLLDVLTREGVLINVSVRFWRGCKKLKPEDLGLDAQDVSDRLISLGHKRLLPKEATSNLSLIEGRAHALIEANTFPFLNGLSHFLPNTKLDEVTAKLRTLETEFWEGKEEFVRHYSRHRANAMDEWRTAAARLVADPEMTVAAIGAAYPTTLDKHFGFDVTLFQLALPERLQVDLVTLADQQTVVAARQEAAQRASEKISAEVETFVADCVASLREQTATLCEEMLQSISDGKTDGVHQKTLNRLIRFIDQFRQMNFANDTAMEEQLDRVRRELLSRTAADYRDSRSAQQKLKQGISALADKARELAKADATELVQQFGQLGRRRFNLAA
jgi:Protein of unknown function (DUF3150)